MKPTRITRRRGALLAVPFLTISIASGARATDTWTTVRPGVEWLHRTTDGSVPQDIHAVRVDLTLPNLGFRASRNESGSERGVTTPTFAADVDALVAINGDWSNGFTPVGLAIGAGQQWHDHYNDPNISSRWGFFACDIWNGCDVDALGPLSEAWWFTQPTLAPTRYWNAVGANGVLLYNDGERGVGCYDGCGGDTCRHPRTAACVEQDGLHAWLIVIDGRRPGASGMKCGEVRDLVLELGCWDAAMLDGGGSSTMWIDGAVRNEPSDGSPRTVANHIGIVYHETVDPACGDGAGAHCEGSTIVTCSAGAVVGEGDCAAFGATCQEDGTWAFCVDPRCPDGDGTAAACLDATRIASCNDGSYGEGDCGVFGLACGTDAGGGSSCMDPRCEAGPNGRFCAATGTLASCAQGVYEESDCTASGFVCAPASGGAVCMDPRCQQGADGSFCLGAASWAACAGGTYSETACLEGEQCIDTGTSASCEPIAVETDDDSANATPEPSTPEARPWGEDACSGCRAEGGRTPAGAWVGAGVGLAALIRRRRGPGPTARTSASRR